MAPSEDEIVRPAFLVLAPRRAVDEASRHAADESASFLRATKRTVVVGDAFPERETERPDGLLLVLAEGGGAGVVESIAPAMRGRAVALAAVVDEAPEGAALATRARRVLRAAGALVLERQVVLPRSAFGVYGLESEPLRDKLEALSALLHHEADRLLAKREGWLEPDEDHPDEKVVLQRDDDGDE